MQTLVSLDYRDSKTKQKTSIKKQNEIKKEEESSDVKRWSDAYNAVISSDITTYTPGTGISELMFKFDTTTSQDPHPPPSLSILGPKVSMTAVVLPQFVVILTQPFSWYACCKFVVTWCVCHRLHGIRKFLCVAVPAWSRGGGGIMALNGACDGAACRRSNPDKLFTC